MRRKTFIKLTNLVLVCLLALTGFIHADVKTDTQKKPWLPAELVIVISMDGMRYDYPDRGHFPGFMRMEKEGLRVQRMLPTFPANTFPSHVSLATGTTPEQHGIIDNDFFDKRLGKSFDKYAASEWLEAEPIWVTAERQGKRAAVYYWLGSDGPWQGVAATYYKTPFKATLSEQEKLNQIIQWMDLPLHQRPQLIMSYWHGADSEGHRFGPEHFLVTKKIAEQDAFLQQLQSAIDARAGWDYITLVVVSDHGMTTKGTAIDLPALFEQGKFAQEKFEQGKFAVHFKMSNAVAHINLKKGSDRTEVFNFLKQQTGFDVYYKDLMPEAIRLNHASRSGEIILMAQQGFYFSQENIIEKGMSKIIKGGMHGLPANYSDMATIFFAQGRGIQKQSRLEMVNMIDVAPSIASLLTINAPLQAQGKAFLPNIQAKP